MVLPRSRIANTGYSARMGSEEGVRGDGVDVVVDDDVGAFAGAEMVVVVGADHRVSVAEGEGEDDGDDDGDDDGTVPQRMLADDDVLTREHGDLQCRRAVVAVVRAEGGKMS